LNTKLRKVRSFRNLINAHFRTGEKRDVQPDTSTASLVHSFTFSGRLYFRRPHPLFMDMEDWGSAFPMAWQGLHLEPFATQSTPQHGVGIFRAGPLTTSGFDVHGINPAETRITTVEEIRYYFSHPLCSFLMCLERMRMQVLNMIQLQGGVGRKSATLADLPNKRSQIQMSPD
jgi:hypothetical protein